LLFGIVKHHEKNSSVFAGHVVNRKNSGGISKNEMLVGTSISFFEMSPIIFFKIYLFIFGVFCNGAL
jgi:hypothetical protein